MAFALGLFSVGYSCSKLLAVALLGSVSGVALAASLAGECAALLLVRAAIGNWRFATTAGDSTIISLLVHVCYYLIMLAAPFPVIRMPFFLSPSVYTGFIAWTLCGANPLMLVLAYTFDDFPTIDWQSAAMMLGVTTVACVLGVACALASMEKRWRAT